MPKLPEDATATVEFAKNSTVTAAFSGSFGNHAAGQDLVDPASIEVHDLEPPPKRLHSFTDLWEMLNFRDDQPGDGFVVTVVRQSDPELVCHFVGRHPPRQEPGAILPLHSLGLGTTFV